MEDVDGGEEEFLKAGGSVSIVGPKKMGEGWEYDLPEPNHLDFLVDLEGFYKAHDFYASVAAIRQDRRGDMQNHHIDDDHPLRPFEDPIGIPADKNQVQP